MQTLNFIIHAPSYNACSGGIVVLHHLALELKQLGHNAFIHADKTIPGKDIPLWTLKKVPENYIVIYPEITHGNPLNATNIVRWVLNTPGKVKKDTQDSWNRSDHIYKFLDYFHVNSTFKSLGLLQCFNFNLHLFDNYNYSRQGHVHMTRKSFGKPLKSHFKDSQNIDSKACDFNELKNIFNEASTFISYDTVTYYSLIAAMCGCISIVIPDQGISKNEWQQKAPTLNFGVAYGKDDVQWALDTMHLVKDHLRNIEQSSKSTIEVFIDNCSNLFF